MSATVDVVLRNVVANTIQSRNREITFIRESKVLGLNLTEEIIVFPLLAGKTAKVWFAGGKNDNDNDSSFRLRNITDNVNIYTLTPSGANGIFEGDGITSLGTNGPFASDKKLAFQAINTSLIDVHNLNAFIVITID